MSIYIVVGSIWLCVCPPWLWDFKVVKQVSESFVFGVLIYLETMYSCSNVACVCGWSQIYIIFARVGCEFHFSPLARLANDRA